MLLVGWQEGHPARKKLEWWGAGVVICLEQGADLHMAGPADVTATHWVCVCVCVVMKSPAFTIISLSPVLAAERTSGL